MHKLIATLAAIFVVSAALPVLAIEAPILMREEANPVGSDLNSGCPLQPNLTGDCGNLRYYNMCSGYIWIYSLGILGESAGVLFEGPCIESASYVEKAITYWRNTAPGYGQTVDVLLDADTDNDACSDFNLASDLNLDPGLRWNCSALSVCIPDAVSALVLRGRSQGGVAPTFATDGPFSQDCDPVGVSRSFYYGLDGSGSKCTPWVGPTGRFDNFLYWLVVDLACPPTATESRSWGEIKALFR